VPPPERDISRGSLVGLASRASPRTVAPEMLPIYLANGAPPSMHNQGGHAPGVLNLWPESAPNIFY